MTKIYTQYSTTAVSVGVTGHQHERDASAKGEEPTSVDCDVCEPFLVSDGWVYDPDLVPLTLAQIANQEKREREGNAAVRQASEALARAATRAIDDDQKATDRDAEKAARAAEREAKRVEKAAKAETKVKADPKPKTEPKAEVKPTEPAAPAEAPLAVIETA